jgi:hypothetical protein
MQIARLEEEVKNTRRELIASEEGIEPEARRTLGKAMAGEVPAFRQLQEAAKAAPEEFVGLEERIRLMAPEEERAQMAAGQDVERQRKRHQEKVQEEREWRQKFARADQEAMRREERDENLARRQGDKERGESERNKERNEERKRREETKAHRESERAEKDRRSQIHRDVGAEMAEERHAEQAGVHEATKVLHEMALRQAHVTGLTVENQMKILQQNGEVQVYLQMVAQRAAAVRQALGRQVQQARRQIEEDRTEQFIGAFPQ